MQFSVAAVLALIPLTLGAYISYNDYSSASDCTGTLSDSEIAMSGECVNLTGLSYDYTFYEGTPVPGQACSITTYSEPGCDAAYYTNYTYANSGDFSSGCIVGNGSIELNCLVD